MEREGLQNPSRQGWVSKKEGVLKKSITSDGNMRMTFLFASGVFSLPGHADHPTQGQGSCSSCLWKSGKSMLEGFFPCPYLSFHRSMNFVCAQHSSIFQVWRVDFLDASRWFLPCLVIPVPACFSPVLPSCCPANQNAVCFESLVAAALLQVCCITRCQGRKCRIILEAKRMYGFFLSGFFFP